MMSYWMVLAIVAGLGIYAWVQYIRMQRQCKALKRHQYPAKAQLFSQEEYRYMLDQTKEAFLILDLDGKIVQSNAKACQILLYKQQDLMSRSIFDIDPQFSEQTWHTFWQCLRKNSAYPLETNFIRKDGAPIEIEARYHYVERSQHALCFCLAEDVSHLQYAKEQLLLANNKIESLNLKLQPQLQEDPPQSTKGASLPADSDSHWLPIFSDMQFSLKVMMNMLDYLYKTAFGDTQQVLSKNAHSTAHGLLVTIDNVLDTVRATSHDLVLSRTPFQCQAIIDQAFRRLRPLAKDRRVRLNAIIAPSVPQRLLGDEQRIQRILFNLVANALINNTTGDIYVRIKCATQNEAPAACIEVTIKDHDAPPSLPQDTNDAAATEALNAIDRTLLETTHEYQLRISICRTLITLMGGTFWSHQHPGRSAAYAFTLKLERAAEDTSPTPHTHAIEGVELDLESDNALNLLVAEDSFVNQKVMKLTVRALGHHFSHVRTGTHTLKRLNEHTFDVLLIDLSTSKGLYTLKKVSRAAIRKNIYIIGMTELQPTAVQECIAKLNLDDIVTKPIDQGELKLALKCALTAKQNSTATTSNPTPTPIYPGREQAPDHQANASTPQNRFALQPENKDVQPLSAEEISALVNLTQPQTAKTQQQPHQIAENAILKLKRNFIDTTPDMIAQIYHAATQADSDLIRSTAQAIKASTAYFDAKDLEAPLEKIIHLATDKDYKAIFKYLDEVKDAFKIIIKRLQEE